MQVPLFKPKGLRDPVAELLLLALEQQRSMRQLSKPVRLLLLACNTAQSGSHRWLRPVVTAGVHAAIEVAAGVSALAQVYISA